jgi:TPR repeat protein
MSASQIDAATVVIRTKGCQRPKSKMPWPLYALILGFLHVVSAAAGPLEDAEAAIRRRDYTTAARIIRPLAESGDATAQYNLGVFYDNGLGVPQDKINAYIWFSLAAAQGRKGAAAIRDLMARRMTPGQIAEAQKLAREWKPVPKKLVPSR